MSQSSKFLSMRGAVGTPECLVDWSEVRVAWELPSLCLVSEVRQSGGGLCAGLTLGSQWQVIAHISVQYLNISIMWIFYFSPFIEINKDSRINNMLMNFWIVYFTYPFYIYIINLFFYSLRMLTAKWLSEFFFSCVS